MFPGAKVKECAFFDYINDAPDDANKALLVKRAMEAIEQENPRMQGVLPKEVYGQLVPEEEPELLSRIVRVFKDIPEDISIDIFGQIYEYFLGNFALAEGQGGGAFYTPASVVQYMVEVLRPVTGDKKFLDPACGSGGMFVQAARYMHRHNASNQDLMSFRCYGVEKEPDTVKLAKMNLLLNNVRGEITEANSFYSDPYNAFGNFDYVMANPPFNVDEVVFEKVADDARFNTYGVPRNKTKSTKKASDKKETVPNANYLWIGYFATALNENGKAALVWLIRRVMQVALSWKSARRCYRMALSVRWLPCQAICSLRLRCQPLFGSSINSAPTRMRFSSSMLAISLRKWIERTASSRMSKSRTSVSSLASMRVIAMLSGH